MMSEGVISGGLGVQFTNGSKCTIWRSVDLQGGFNGPRRISCNSGF